MANIAQMVNVIAPIMTNEKGMFLQPIYFPLVEFSKQRGNASLQAWVSSPMYKIPQQAGESSYLDVSATYNAGARELFVNVLNRSKDKDITASIEGLAGVAPGAPVTVWQMNHTDLKATHTFGDDNKVRPRTSTGALSNGQFTFPAHSLTILKLKVS